MHLSVCMRKYHLLLYMNAGFGMMGRHGDLLQDLLEYRVSGEWVLVQQTLLVAILLKLACIEWCR